MRTPRPRGTRASRRAVAGLATSGLLIVGGCVSSPPDAVLPPTPIPTVAPDAVDDQGDGGDADHGDGGGATVAPAPDTAGSPSGDATAPGGLAPGDSVPASEFMTKLRVAQEGFPSVRVRIDLTGPQTLTVEGDMDTRDGQKMRATVTDPEAGEIEVIALAGRMWVRMPDVLGTDAWYVVSEEQIVEFELEDLVAELEYSEMWVAWDTGATAIKYVGSADRDGQRRYHYTVSVDMAAALEAQGEPVPPLMPESVRYDVYLDERDLMREVSFEVLGMRGQMVMSDWGTEDLGIEEPQESSPLPF